jgi:tetratricopeptide (TPR) repeat protein
MSNNEIVENEDQNDYIEQEDNSPSGMSLMVDKIKNWVNTQNKTAVIAVSAVLIAGIGFGAYHFLYKLPREKEAMVAIYPVQELFDVDSFRMVLKDGPKLAEKYNGTKAGELCAYMAGMSYLNTGNYKKALDFLKSVDFDDAVMNSQATGNIGDVYVEMKDLDNAVEYYNKAISRSGNDFSTIWWRKKVARVYEKKNDYQSALEQYESIKKNNSEDEAASDIDKYIAKAKAKLDSY